MKSVQYHAWGGPEVVGIEEVPIPQIKADEALIKVRAAGVNPIDWKVCAGYFENLFTDPFPFPMGWDFSGEVVEVSPHTTFKVGDEVYGLIKFFEPGGCFSEYVAAPVNQIALKPKTIDPIQAAGVPLVTLTAWQALLNLQPNERVLIHAGGGAVGQMAIQLAKQKGTYVVATGSQRSQSLILAAGCDQFVDYEAVNFESTVSNIDYALDLVGGEYTQRTLSIIKPGGKLTAFTGPLSPECQAQAEAKAIDAAFTVVQPNGAQLEAITELFNASALTINIEQVFPLAEVRRALETLKSGRCHGKIILDLDL